MQKFCGSLGRIKLAEEILFPGEIRGVICVDLKWDGAFSFRMHKLGALCPA